MSAHDLPSVFVSRRGDQHVGADPFRTVVWLRGDHDIATRVDLSVAIASAARLDDADVVVDLSGVTFLDASTISVLVVAHDQLRAHARRLSVCSPTPLARRMLDVCGLERLIDDQPTAARGPGPSAGTALGSWVEVPVSDPDPNTHRATSHEHPLAEPVHVSVR